MYVIEYGIFDDEKLIGASYQTVKGRYVAIEGGISFKGDFRLMDVHTGHFVKKEQNLHSLFNEA